MCIINGWGPRLNRELWTRLIGDARPQLAHDLWCSAIRTLAVKVIERREMRHLDLDDDEERQIVEDLISRWQEEAFPLSDLYDLIGERDYFVYIYVFSWDEALSFGGDACYCADDVAGDLRSQYSQQSDYITYELVSDHFEHWRTKFLRRVLDEAAKLALTNEQTCRYFAPSATEFQCSNRTA